MFASRSEFAPEQEKGHAFEQYLIELFPKSTFTLVHAVQNIHNRKRYVDGKCLSDDPNAPYDPNAPEWTDPTEKQSFRRNANRVLTKDEIKITNQLADHFAQMTDAFLKDDMLAVSRFYADSGLIVMGKSEVFGRKALDQYWLSLKGRGKSWKLTTLSVEVFGKIALHDGISDLVIVQNGSEYPSRGRFLVVWEKQPSGTWKIIKDYFMAF